MEGELSAAEDNDLTAADDDENDGLEDSDDGTGGTDDHGSCGLMFEGFDRGALDELGAGGDERGAEGEFENDVYNDVWHDSFVLKVNEHRCEGDPT